MLSRIDHVNIVVQDLDRMLEFYTSVLGLKVTKRVSISGPWISSVVDLPEVVADVVYLDPPTGPRVELIRYHNPEASRPANLEKPNTPGLRHLAFGCDDIDAAAARLDQHDIARSSVQQVPDSQVTYAGNTRKRLLYFRDPEGNLLELAEYKQER